MARRPENGNIVGRRFIRSDSSSNFTMFKIVLIGSETRKLDFIWTEAKRRWTSILLVWKTSCQEKRSYSNWRWQKGSNTKMQRKSWESPGYASTSTAKLNIHGRKFMLCVWWVQLGGIPTTKNGEATNLVILEDIKCCFFPDSLQWWMVLYILKSSQSIESILLIIFNNISLGRVNTV